MRKLVQFLRGESAATAVEYAVMLAMIILACISAIMVVGQQTANLWSNNDSGLQSAFNGGS
jgi:pilus assembly protein Flp/PilA